MPQLSVWMQLVFDKPQRKMKYIQLCQATKLLCPVVVKTISVLSLLVPQTGDIFFLQRAVSDPCLKPFHFCTANFQISLQSTPLIHGAQKPSGKTLRSPLGLALQPPRQLPGEEHVSQFAVTVGEAAIVALLTMEIMEADSASVMSQ